MSVLKDEPFSYMLNDVGQLVKYLGMKYGKRNISDSDVWFMSVNSYLSKPSKKYKGSMGTYLRLGQDKGWIY